MNTILCCGPVPNEIPKQFLQYKSAEMVDTWRVILKRVASELVFQWVHQSANLLLYFRVTADCYDFETAAYKPSAATATTSSCFESCIEVVTRHHPTQVKNQAWKLLSRS